MKGTYLLDNDGIRRVSAVFTWMYEARNRGLFMIGVSTGGRISELLGLRVGDVYQNGSAVTDLLYNKSAVKGGEVSRAVPVCLIKKSDCIIFHALIHSINPVLGGTMKRPARHVCYPHLRRDKGLEAGRSK